MKKKILNIIKLLFILISTFLSIYFIKVISDLNILPNKYFYLVVIITMLFNIMSLLFIIFKNKILNIIGIIICILIIVLSIIGLKYGKRTVDFFNSGFGNKSESIIYSVVVLNDSDCDSIDDLDLKKIGYFKNDGNNYLNMLNDKISPVLVGYDTLFDLYDDLTLKEIDAFIVNEAYLDILEEYVSIDVKVLYNFNVFQDVMEEIYSPKLKNVNILISGSDSRSGNVSSYSRSDVNMIMTINMEQKTILLTSIPRDYYVQLHGTTGLKDKLTHSGIYGLDMTKNTLEDLLDIEIDYSIKVGFKSVIDIVDLIGGIDIVSDTEFVSHCRDGGAIRTHVKLGLNHFNGGQALSYARERYAYVEGDRHRILNQQQVLEAVMNKIFSDKSLLLKYDELLDAFSSLYITDIPSYFIKSFIKEQIDDMSKWNVIKQSLNGYGSSGYTYSMPGRYLYVMIPDSNSLNSASFKIKEIQFNI